MKTLKKIAALTIVAGGFVAAGLSGSADAGHYGGYFPSYGYSYNYYRPVVSYPRVKLHCDSYGCHYFYDSYGSRFNVFGGYGNQYYFDSYGAKHFVYGY